MLKIMRSKQVLYINFIFFIFFMISDSLDIFIPLLFKSRGFSVVAYGSFQSITVILRMIIIIVIANSSFKIKKRVLMATLGLNAIGIFIYQGVESELYFYCFFAVLVITRSIVNITLNPTLASLVPTEHLGKVFGIRDVFLNTGSVVGLILTGYLTKQVGYGGYYVFVFISFMVLIVFSWLLKIKTKEIPIIDTKDDLNEEPHTQISKKEAFFKLKDKKNYVIFCMIGVLICIGNGIQSYYPIIGSNRGIVDNQIYLLFSGSLFITSVFSMLGGIIIDKYNKKKLYCLYVLSCLVSVMILLPSFKSTFVISLAIIGVIGVLDNVHQVYFFEYFAEDNIDLLWAINGSLQMGIGFIIPICTGLLLEKSFQYTILFSSIAYFLAFVCVLKLKLKKL